MKVYNQFYYNFIRNSLSRKHSKFRHPEKDLLTILGYFQQRQKHWTMY